MAEEVIDKIVGESASRSRTLEIVLHGGEGYTDHLSFQLIQKYGMDQPVAEHLASTYGGCAWDVCELSNDTGKEWPRFGSLLVEGFPYIEAEVVYACQEYACTIEDILSRRTRLAFLNKSAGIAAIPRIADIMAKELGWTDLVKKQQIESAMTYMDSYGGGLPAAETLSLLRQADAPEKVFEALDVDSNGLIDRQDAIVAGTNLGVSDKDVDLAFRQMDTNGKGRVPLEMFKLWWDSNPSSRLYRRLCQEIDSSVGQQAA
jgi:glycerol-3-phosphate dehydrogenase